MVQHIRLPRLQSQAAVQAIVGVGKLLARFQDARLVVQGRDQYRPLVGLGGVSVFLHLLPQGDGGIDLALALAHQPQVKARLYKVR